MRYGFVLWTSARQQLAYRAELGIQKLLFTVGGLFLPLEMFPDWLRRVAGWLPFQFITYVPARAFVAFEPKFVLRAAVGQTAYVVTIAALVALVWRRAQRRLVVHGG